MRPLIEIVSTLQYQVDRLEEAGDNAEDVNVMNQALEELREHDGLCLGLDDV